MIVLTALADAGKGLPLTATRPYALLSAANVPLIDRLVSHFEGERLVVVTEDETLRAHCGGLVVKDRSWKPPADALIVPTDLYLEEKPVGKGYVSVEGGSDELAAAKALYGERGEVLTKGFRVNYPWDLLAANQAACDALTGRRAASAVVEDCVTIHGEVVIGNDTVVKAGTYIEGPVVIGNGCVIGPHAHLRPHTSIGDGCTIGKTEIYDSVIMRKSVSKHAAYLGHSVLGEDVNVGAFTVTSDYRHDGQEHVTLVDGVKVATGRRKLGAFIGDGSRIAIQTGFYPGRKLWPGRTTLPGEVVTEDKR